MIVVAIIGILAAIAIPAYQNYVAKSQVSVGLADISGGKTNTELKLSEGIAAAISTPANIGIPTTTAACSTISAAVAINGETSIVCTLKGSSKINSKTIGWYRTADLNAQAASGGNAAVAESTGSWTCKTNVVTDLAPKSCVQL